MKTTSAVLLGIILLSSSLLAEKVKGHTKKDGTYVPPYSRSDRNSTERDNYSAKGNTNPNTGKEGSKTPKK